QIVGPVRRQTGAEPQRTQRKTEKETGGKDRVGSFLQILPLSSSLCPLCPLWFKNIFGQGAMVTRLVSATRCGTVSRPCHNGGKAQPDRMRKGPWELLAPRLPLCLWCPLWFNFRLPSGAGGLSMAGHDTISWARARRALASVAGDDACPRRQGRSHIK